jgi:hypothetical protein
MAAASELSMGFSHHANFMLASSACSFMSPWQRRKIMHACSKSGIEALGHQKYRRRLSLSDPDRPGEV